MQKKYKLTDSFTYELYEGKNIALRRIQALIDIPEISVAAGDIGGFVQSEFNLSHEGLCWIDDNAKVYGNAVVLENAVVADNVTVCNEATISGDAHVGGRIYVGGSAIICGDTFIANDSAIIICQDACISNTNDVFWIKAPIYNTHQTCTDTFFRCSDGIVRVYSPMIDLVVDLSYYVKHNVEYNSYNSTRAEDKFKAVIDLVKVAMDLNDKDVK